MKYIKPYLTKRLFLLLLLPLSVALTGIASHFPNFTEAFYARGVYPVISQGIGFLFAWIPVSMSEIILAALAFGVIGYLVWTAASFIKAKGDRHRRIHLCTRFITNLAVGSAVIYFAFVLLCGLNYYRHPFSLYSGLEIRPSSAQELAALCGELLERANGLRLQVPEDADGITALGCSHFEMAERTRAAFLTMSGDYDVLAGNYSRPKPVLLSSLMSYTQITGFFFPYTFEPNVNVHVPAYTIPATMCHEQTHLRGFMREDEANFIAYLACRQSGDPVQEYSGVMLALVHSMNGLYGADYDMFCELRRQYSDGLNRDLQYHSEYWKRHDGTVAKVSDKINDTYLKVNKQTDGVKSYGRMVDLLLADYRSRHAEA